MARKSRIFIEGYSQHIKLDGIDGVSLFQDKNDFDEFKSLLKQTSISLEIEINAYILLKKYIQMLIVSKDLKSLSKFIQTLSRKYVLYYNKKYNRSGTLWKGRFKSSLVENGDMFFLVMKHIESKPIYEKVSSNLYDYPYNSIHKNLFGKKDDIVTFNKQYKNLAFTTKKRLKAYKKYFDMTTDIKIYEFISNALDKQLITGSDIFIKDIENKLGISINSTKRGRPKKQSNKGKTMYKNLVILDKTKHKDLKIKPLTNLNFAKSLNAISIATSEVALVGAHFPIVFTSDDENKNSNLVALVSLGGDSLAINDNGKWITNYVPMHLRRYPFLLANTKESDKKVVLIDEDSELFSTTEGNELFDKDGNQTQTLSHAVKFLQAADEQFTLTNNVVKTIVESGILEDREIAVGEGDDKKILVNGFKVVSKEKLNELSDDILATWVRNGIITFIDAHLKSLENIQALFNLAYQKQN